MARRLWTLASQRIGNPSRDKRFLPPDLCIQHKKEPEALFLLSNPGDPGASRFEERLALVSHSNSGDPGASRFEERLAHTSFTNSGDPGASRTHNLFLRTELLYPLSYPAKYMIQLYHEFIEEKR